MAVLSCTAKGRDSPTTPEAPRDPPADVEPSEGVEEDVKKEDGEKAKPEELPAEDSPAKMEVDPTDSPSDEQKSKPLEMIMYLWKRDENVQ